MPKKSFDAKKLRLIIGGILFLVVVVGAIAGSFLVKQSQDLRQQAAGGALPTSSENVLNVCVVIEKDGVKLEEWDKVPESTFRIQVGPITSGFDANSQVLPSDWESKLESISINSKDLTDATLENGVNARCAKVGQVSPAYVYKSGSISSGAQWGGLKYNDVFSAGVDSFFDYDNKLFDTDTSNNSGRNTNADGHIFVDGRTDRKLVLLATLQSALVEPTPTPTPSPEPTETTQLESLQGIQGEPEATPEQQSIGLAPTATPTTAPTPTPTSQAVGGTSSPTPTPTSTPAQLAQGPTSTPTPTPTRTPTPTPTPIWSPGITPSPTPTFTPSPTPIPGTSGVGGTTNTPTPTPLGGTQTTTTTTTSTSSDSARTNNTLDPNQAPVSGNGNVTLMIILAGVAGLALGMWWLFLVI